MVMKCRVLREMCLNLSACRCHQRVFQASRSGDDDDDVNDDDNNVNDDYDDSNQLYSFAFLFASNVLPL